MEVAVTVALTAIIDSVPETGLWLLFTSKTMYSPADGAAQLADPNAPELEYSQTGPVSQNQISRIAEGATMYRSTELGMLSVSFHFTLNLCPRVALNETPQYQHETSDVPLSENDEV
jgi:hypothetical protein